MDVVIIANFCVDIERPANSRFTYIANLLFENNEVELISSDFSHSTKKKRECDFSRFPYMVTLIKEPGYQKNICVQRFLSHRVWGQNVYKYIKARKKPDVVYCAIPSLTAAALVGRYCKENGIRFIIDIQDLWPEAFQMVFNVPVLSNLIFAPFKWIVDGIYKRADCVCAVSQTYVDRALRVNSTVSEGHSVFLGTNLSAFDENVKNNPVEKPENELWLAYCGTLGASYDLICVFDALKMLADKGVPIPKFVVMGNGHRREEFENYAKAKELDVVFTGRLPYDQMCGMLSACDITVNPIKEGSAGSIINKHADYAASGLPVINSQESPEYRRLVDTYKMGFNCNNEDAADMAEKIEMLIYNKDLRLEMGENARRCAEEKFDRRNSYSRIIQCITE